MLHVQNSLLKPNPKWVNTYRLVLISRVIMVRFVTQLRMSLKICYTLLIVVCFYATLYIATQGYRMPHLQLKWSTIGMRNSMHARAYRKDYVRMKRVVETYYTKVLWWEDEVKMRTRDEQETKPNTNFDSASPFLFFPLVQHQGEDKERLTTPRMVGRTSRYGLEIESRKVWLV